MAKKTKAQHQAEYLKYANDLLQYAVAPTASGRLESLDNDDDDILPDDDNLGLDSDNDLSEVLELIGHKQC